MASETSKTVELIQAALEQSQPEVLRVRKTGTTLKATVDQGNLLVRELAGLGLGAAAGGMLEPTPANGDQPTASTRSTTARPKARLKPKKNKAKKSKVKAKFKP